MISEMEIINDHISEKELWCNECSSITIHQCELHKYLDGKIYEEQTCGKCGEYDIINHGY